MSTAVLQEDYVTTPLPHDSQYYAQCFVGGVLSSSIRWIQTPLDGIKCNLQVGNVSSVSHGWNVLRAEGALFRGLGPTVLAYGSQSGTKYFLYELLKDSAGPSVEQNRGLVYLAAAGTAESCADILMCPWETLKVKVQTEPNFPRRLIPAFLELRGSDAFRSLVPLWGRQLPCTMANFYTFETTVEWMYRHWLTQPKDTYSSSTQLAVTFGAGYVAGIVSTIVSHPFDSLISLQPKYPDQSLRQIARHVGLVKLCTKGLLPRMGMTGTIIAFQWWTYDSFKTMMGMGTTGGKL